MLTEPVQANPSPDANTFCRVSMSNRNYDTLAVRLKFHPFMVSFNSKVSDDQDFCLTAWVHCKNFVNETTAEAFAYSAIQDCFTVKLMTLDESVNQIE